MNQRLRWAFSLPLALAALAGEMKDTGGWGKVKWGMTVDEVRAVYGLEVLDSTAVPEPNSTFIERLTIPSINIGDAEMKASLQTLRGADQIKQVSLSLKGALRAR